MRFLLFGIMFLIFLTACTNRGTYPNYINQSKLEGDVAVFARVGAKPNQLEAAINHLRIRKSLKSIKVDDLGWAISVCERDDSLYCLSGGLPIILPRETGSYHFETDEGLMKVELIAPSVEETYRGVRQKTCEFSIVKLIVTHKDENFEYIISKFTGVVSIAKTIPKWGTDHWYLVSGRLIDLESACET